ncbi:MAG: hypothetical protein EA355_02765 [Rhodobacteraceae bacterium]|nr:MAG: hypothetical protein EA355_02765 [Paracoccaceae bacterium]
MARRPSGGAAARFGRPGRADRARAARLLGRMAAGALALLVVGAAALWAALARGPIDISDAIPRIEAAMARADARLEIGAARIAFSAGDAPRPGLEVDHLRLLDASGRVLFAAPNARIDIGPLDMLDGRFRPRRVTARGVSLVAVRSEDGRLSVAGVGIEGDPAAALEAEILALDALGEIVLSDVALTFDDRQAGRAWRADGAAARLRRTAEGVAFSVSAQADGAGGRVAAAFAGSVGPDGAGRAAGSVAGLTGADVAALWPASRAFADVDAAATLDLALETGPGLAPVSLDVALAVGPGQVTMGAGAQGFRRLAAAATVDFATRTAQVRRFAVDADGGTVEATGEAALTADGSVTLDVDLHALALRDPRLVAAPVAFDGGRALAQVRTAPLSVEIADLRLWFGSATLAAAGAVTRDGGPWRGAAQAVAEGLDVEALLALWPPGAAPGALRWIAANVAEGRIERADAGAVFDAETADFGLSFAFSEATAHYFRPLPPIDRASGWATLDGDVFSLTLGAGGVSADVGGRIDLAGSSVTIPDVYGPDPAAEIAAVGSGPLPTILTVLDSPPLGFVGALGLAPGAVVGAVEAVTRLRLPLRRDLPLTEVSAEATARLTDVAVSPPGLDRRITADSLALAVDTEGLRLSGDGALDGVALSLAWRERFRPNETTVEASGVLTTDDLARFGLDAGAAASGSVGVRATLRRAAGGPATVAADIDLTRLALDAAPLPWSKSAGAAGRATASATLGAEGVRLRAFEATAPGLALAGSAAFGAGGGLLEMTLDRARIDGFADATMALSREGEAWRARIGGALLDLARLADAIDGAATDGPEGGGTPFTAEIEVDRLGLGRLSLSPGAGSARRDAAGVTATFDGRVGEAGAVRVALGESAPGALRVDAEDAGALLREAGLFAGGVGGRLRVDAASGPPLTGRARIDGMRVVGAATLARLAEAADADAAARALRDSGVVFDRIEAEFRQTGAGVEVENGLARSPLLGVTFAGGYDAAQDALDVSGVVTPLYVVNSLLGRVPIIGGLLTGGPGEGVFAFRYSISGPASDPRISVNPFSGLTPGFLRGIFDGASDGEPFVEPPELRAGSR